MNFLARRCHERVDWGGLRASADRPAARVPAAVERLAAADTAAAAEKAYWELDDYVVVQNLVAAGLGVSLLPQAAVTAYRNPDVVIRDGDQWGRRLIGVAHREGADLVPATAAFLIELCGQEPSGSR